MRRWFNGSIVATALAAAALSAVISVSLTRTTGQAAPSAPTLGGKPDFSSLFFTINDAQFRYGAFLTDLISFVLTAAAVFFFVVKPINTIVTRRRPDEVVAPAEASAEIELLREIRDALKAR